MPVFLKNKKINLLCASRSDGDSAVSDNGLDLTYPLRESWGEIILASNPRGGPEEPLWPVEDEGRGGGIPGENPGRDAMADLPS